MISLIHPSRARGDMAYLAFRNWTEKAKDWNNFEYILSLDTTDKSYYNWPAPVRLDYSILRRNNDSAIEAINAAARIARGNLLVVISDDFDCPHHWDYLLQLETALESDFLMKTADGLQKTLITLPIMDRTYYNRFGYIYNPAYGHMFADQEMTAVGHLLGRVITSGLQFPHLHYTTGRSPKDAINFKNDATWAQGEALYNKRIKINFGVEQPVMNYHDIVWR